MAGITNEMDKYNTAFNGNNQPLTQQEMISGKAKMEQDMLESTQRALQNLSEAEDTGAATLEALARQNEQIDNIANNLDRMRTDLAYSDIMLQKIASPFAFMYMKKESKEFATVFGTPAHWSGLLQKKRGLLGFKTRYFALANYRLLYFNAQKTGVNVAAFNDPKGEINVKGAEVIGNKDKCEITIKSGQEKWILKANDVQDYCGWITMLQRHSDQKITQPITEAADPEKSGAQAEVIAKYKPQQQTPQANIPTTIDEQVDANLDLMMSKLDNLGEMAFETGNAIKVQNEKLDVVSESMDNTSNHMEKIQNKHARRLK